MGVVCGIADSQIEKQLYPEGAPWLYDDNKSYDNPSINGLITWAFALITFVILPSRVRDAYVLSDFKTSCRYRCTYL